MQAVRSVRDVSDAEVLAARQQVLDAHRNQGAERNLKWPATEIEIGRAARGGMQIDAIAADAHRIVEPARSIGAQRICDVLLDDRELGADAARLAHVRRLGESDRASDNIASEMEAGVASATIGPRGFGLEPV